MSDEPRDEELPEEEDEGADAEAPEDAEQAPPPATWAGRARAGAGDDDETAAQSESGGMTDEFDAVEAELSAGFEEITGEHAPDEREEPPDEFEFEPDDEEAAEVEEGVAVEPEVVEGAEVEEAAEVEAEVEAEVVEGAELEPEGEAAEVEPPTQETTEGDTLAISDREAAQEAAHAGLRARAEHAATHRGVTPGTQGAPAAAVAAPAASGPGQPPKRNMWWRFLAASFVIVASMASATAVSFLLFLSDIAEGLNDDDAIGTARAELDAVEGGAPQTILILGSDKRGGTPGDPGRSDTAMLLRVDPDKEFLALLSLPRDLKVEIPGYGTDKLNAAYSYGEQAKGSGGEELAIKTIKEYLGIPINHVVNVDFEGFYEAVNAIDCVYIDVDRHYYNPEGGDYDDIDIEAGYSKLCGYRALDYVRYRHNDNDIVRGARQQDFIREARQRIPPRELLPFLGGGDELIDIFTDNTTSDIDDVSTIIDMLKSFVDVRDAPVRQVELESSLEGPYVVTSNDQVDAAVDQFLGNDLDQEATAPPPEAKPDRPDTPKTPPDEPAGPVLVDATGTAQQYANNFDKFMEEKKAKLPIFYPTQIVSNANSTITAESRAAALAGPDDKDVYYMYKFVVSYQEPGLLSYYGVSGVNWTDPPILKNPSETRQIDGREYMLFYERDRLRLVGWRTDKGAYWVINTLTRALSEDEMLAVATSTRELGG